MSATLLPPLDRRPTHKALPLLRAEISRLTHRRLLRILAALALGVLLLISVIVFLAHDKDPDTAAAVDQWSSCVQSLPPDAPVRENCGPKPGSGPHFDEFSDSRYHAHELLPVTLIGTAIAMAGLAFIMGASSGGAEWSSRSMTLQLLFEPRRMRLLAIKWLALVGTMAALAAVVMSLGVGLGALTATLRGTWSNQVALSGQFRDHLAQQLLLVGGRGLLLVAVAATFGYAIAMLVRNTGASLGVAFVYFVVVENGVRFALLKFGSEPYMLSTNSIASLFPGGIDVPGAAKGRWGELSIVHLSNLRATVTMISYCALLSIPAIWSFTRRDVG